VFSSVAVRWLYDEVDMPAAGKFSHRILLSDGREIALQFATFEYRAFEVHPVGTRNDLTSILRLAEAVEKSGQAPGPVQFNLIRKEAKKAIAAAKRVRGIKRSTYRLRRSPRQSTNSPSGCRRPVQSHSE
jgi:hypothetical protein